MPSGSCLCGELKYEYTGEPQGKAACYCLACRKISGGTNTVNLMIPKANFRVATAPAKEYTTTHESGMKLTVYFCDKCGGVIYKTGDREEFQNFIVLLAGTLDDPDEREIAQPQQELYTKHRPPWLSELTGAAQKNEF